MPTLPLIVLGLFVFVAIFAPYLTQWDPIKHSLINSLLPPFWVEGGDLDHPLGTDGFGRDILARLMYGARASLSVAALSLSIAVTIGVSVGVVAGYVGGRIDSILMRVVDIVLALPTILVALTFAIALGPSFRNLILIIGFLVWPQMARLIRSEVLLLRKGEFVRYATAIGVPNWLIVIRHVFPNVTATLVVAVTLEIGHVILLEASLSFLGAGLPPPSPSWGAMISDGRALIATGWWIALFAGLAILCAVLTFNTLGDWLRDRLDPKLRNA
jgi:peptide/nickel transport system permease protein